MRGAVIDALAEQARAQGISRVADALRDADAGFTITTSDDAVQVTAPALTSRTFGTRSDMGEDNLRVIVEILRSTT